jgi:hypothetical protein
MHVRAFPQRRVVAITRKIQIADSGCEQAASRRTVKSADAAMD